MKMQFTNLAFGLFMATALPTYAQITDPKATEVWSPEPRIVTPGRSASRPPSDAIVLFDGRNLNEWLSAKDSTAAKWQLNPDSSMTVLRGAGDIMTKRSFGDCQLHFEWRTPPVAANSPTGQGRGNSGVFFQNRYEVQVLDSYENRTYSNGQASAVYKQHIPLVNACRPPGDWQTYDIVYTAPRFNADGVQVASGRVTVIHNGVLTQNNVEIKGTTEYIGLPKVEAHGKAPIKLQDHGDPISYRNIWIREL